MGDDFNRIRATVHVLDRARIGESGTKVRVTIWSGPDFRTPTILRGGIFKEPEAARYIADQAVEALERLGIPIEGLSDGHEPAEPLLAPHVACEEYPRLG